MGSGEYVERGSGMDRDGGGGTIRGGRGGVGGGEWGGGRVTTSISYRQTLLIKTRTLGD